MMSSKPWEMKCRMAKLSVARSPEAKPWYAQSKKGKSLRDLQISAICFHWSGEGSTPVGLWAQACRRMMEPSAAAFRVESRPSQSSILVLEEKYGYVLMGRWTLVKIWL